MLCRVSAALLSASAIDFILRGVNLLQLTKVSAPPTVSSKKSKSDGMFKDQYGAPRGQFTFFPQIGPRQQGWRWRKKVNCPQRLLTSRLSPSFKCFDPQARYPLLATQRLAACLGLAKCVHLPPGRLDVKHIGNAGKAVENRTHVGQLIVPSSKMRSNAGPRPILCTGHQSCSDRIQRNVPHGACEVVFVHSHRTKPALPQMPRPTVTIIDVAGVLPMHFTKRRAQPRGIPPVKGKSGNVYFIPRRAAAPKVTSDGKK